MIARPTFMGPWILLAPVLAGSCIFGRMPLGKALAFLLSLMLVPMWFTWANYREYGIATPSFAAFENIHTALIPGIKTLLRKQAGDEERISVIFMEQERNQTAMQGADYLTLEMWKASLPKDKQIFQNTFQHLKREDKTFLWKHLPVTYAMVKAELGDLVLQARGRWMICTRMHSVFVLAALLSLILLWCDYRQRGAASLLFLCCGIVFVPAAFGLQLWWGVRTALPGDLLFIALFGGVLVSWWRLLLLAVLCMGYKVLNQLCYDPAFNCAVACLIMFVMEEIVVSWLEKRGCCPKIQPFIGRRYSIILYKVSCQHVGTGDKDITQKGG